MGGPLLRIAHLYADEMNIYGDRGNILTLKKRAEWRGIPVDIEAIGRGPAPDLSDIDLIFWGGGQDRDQELVFKDAAEHKVGAIRAAIDGGAVVLAVCGGYQLLGEYYVTADGKKLPGLELVDLHTVPGTRRNIGNIVIETSDLGLTPRTLVGFENHSGKTYLGHGLSPLGRVLRGAGNNGEDHTEGVASGNIFGTYLHGSLLPKNPHLADLLIARALRRRWQDAPTPHPDPAHAGNPATLTTMAPPQGGREKMASGGGKALRELDDTAEMAAHQAMVRQLTGAASL